jgi:hypothetical protein
VHASRAARPHPLPEIRPPVTRGSGGMSTRQVLIRATWSTPADPDRYYGPAGGNASAPPPLPTPQMSMPWRQCWASPSHEVLGVAEEHGVCPADGAHRGVAPESRWAKKPRPEERGFFARLLSGVPGAPQSPPVAHSPILFPSTVFVVPPLSPICAAGELP